MPSQETYEFEWNDNYTGHTTDYEPPDPLLLQLVDGLTPGTALDVGCGAGGLVIALAERGWHVTGVDIAPNAIQSAKASLHKRNLAAELHVADAATRTRSRGCRASAVTGGRATSGKPGPWS